MMALAVYIVVVVEAVAVVVVVAAFDLRLESYSKRELVQMEERVERWG